jgi:aspartate aminotransferase-like enzyme
VSLLDPRPYPPDGYAALADRLARLIGCTGDVLWVQGEAILALEALATSLARPGLRAVNVVTSPYGALFGGWLRRGGASVCDVAGAPGQPVAVQAVHDAINRNGADLVALVHAESATGICNPLEDIATLARAHGALVVVDAVASVGGHPLDMAAMGLDAVVVGPQKGLGGPAGVAAVALGPRAWSMIDRANAPRSTPSVCAPGSCGRQMGRPS